MLHTLAIANYRSLRDVVLPLGRLNLITGANGSGKSNLYRALRLLAAVAEGSAVRSLAEEGGLHSVLWAGPERITKGMKASTVRVEGTHRREPYSLRLGFTDGEFGYAIDFGLPIPDPSAPTLFDRDPEIKRECIWGGGTFSRAGLLLDRRGTLVHASDGVGGFQLLRDDLSTGESALFGAADPSCAPEALALREWVRSWRFYDQFRTDREAPARQPRVGSRACCAA